MCVPSVNRAHLAAWSVWMVQTSRAGAPTGASPILRPVSPPGSSRSSGPGAHAPVHAPTAYASFPREILHPPRAWVERTYPNIRRWTDMKAGGHFAALEEPEALASDIRAFFRELR